ncbi:MAG: anti-sigma factor domain-containing protein [Prochlorococcaceae cyanobacterium]|jgi:anti-sigma-K factor RskA
MTPHDPSLDALLAGHALGDLDSEECARLEVLLEKDPALRERLEEFRTTLQLLPLALPEAPLPPERLRRRLSAAGAWPAEERPAAPRWRPLVPALLGLVLLGLGLQLHQTRQELARLERRLEGSAAVAPAGGSGAVLPVGRHLNLVGAAPGIRASGEVMVTGNATHNVLMLNDLPPPPPGHVYRLWAEVDGRAEGCVSFVPTEQGHVGMLIPPQPTSRASRLQVSIEPDALGTAPTGPMVLTST